MCIGNAMVSLSRQRNAVLFYESLKHTQYTVGNIMSLAKMLCSRYFNTIPLAGYWLS